MAKDERADARDEQRQEQIIPADDAEGRTDEVRLYNTAWEDMPPAAAGAEAELGGEAAASRRVAGLPPELEQGAEHRVGEPTAGVEPFLGYDGLATDDLLEWIDEADPDPGELRALYDYEKSHRNREAVTHELKERLRAFGERPGPEGA
ncbi:MAG TPA: hypothetical protein VF832_10570 [Longimicrobiales bacterium]